MPTISQAIAEGARRLSARGNDPRRTAGVLLCHVLGIDRTHLLTNSEQHIDENRYRDYLAMVDRRASGVPVQHLTGHQEFYGLDFIVNAGVLIPRPETEFLVGRIIDLVKATNPASPLIVDIGTGSGCIAVSLAVNLPVAKFIATDASEAALATAKTNAERHRVLDRIEFMEGDLLAPFAGRGFEGTFDILASNPPYVDFAEPELIQLEVLEWEPRQALFGGVGGVEFYRRLLEDGLKFLKPGGHLVVEIGYGQLDAVSEMIEGSSWKLIDVIRDLQGIPRTLTIGKR